MGHIFLSLELIKTFQNSCRHSSVVSEWFLQIIKVKCICPVWPLYLSKDTLNPTLEQSSDLSIYQKKNFKTSWENKVVSPKLHQTLLFKFIESAVKSPSRSSNLFSAPIYQSTQQWVGTIIWFNIAAIYYFQKCWICWYKGQQ